MQSSYSGQPSLQKTELVQQLSLTIEDLKLEIEQLKAENSDLEILLENTTEHSTSIETELHQKNEEMEAYLRHVFCITAAAAAVEDGTFQANMLDNITVRQDELGQLARVFQQMVKEVQHREERLKRQVEELKIEIDQTKRIQDVSQITETDYFQQLKRKVKQLRASSEDDFV